MRILTVTLAAALALTACGGGQDESGSQGQLIDSAFVVTSISVDGVEREVYEPVAISFSPTGIGVATPCNSMNGSVTYVDSTLEVGPLASTKMACEPALMEQDQVIADALGANPAWEVSDGQLTLTGAGTVIVGDAAEL
jgi:heat shock protein HslJ